MKTESALEKILAAGHLAVTSECGPPRGAVPEKVKEKAEKLRGYVDAINVTDNQTAMVRMSSFAACLIIRQMGLHPILQMVTRDRNRLAMQSDILGAYSHGINTMLCLSGDHPCFGDHPMAANVYDLDSIQFIQMVKNMRDEGKFQGGDEILNPPKMFIGAAANPFADPFELRVARLAKKVKAGADFIQTQCIYDLPRFEKWMQGVRDRGLHEKIHILAGVTPFKSAGMAKYMNQVHEEQSAGHECAGRDDQAHGRGSQGQAGRRRSQPLRGDHTAPQRGERRGRFPHHGDRMGREGAGDREKGRTPS